MKIPTGLKSERQSQWQRPAPAGRCPPPGWRPMPRHNPGVPPYRQQHIAGRSVIQRKSAEILVRYYTDFQPQFS